MVSDNETVSYADVIAYVDEAGDMGLSRNLTKDRDDLIGLMCALSFSREQVDAWRNDFRPGFDRFCNAAPIGEKFHITDAFKKGNESWGKVTRQVRDEFFQLLKEKKVPIVYDARRLRIQRESHDRLERLNENAKTQKKSEIRIPDRPSERRIEEELMTGITLKLDALMADCGRQRVDLYFDEIDNHLVKLYRETIDRTRSISQTNIIVKGRDIDAQKTVTGKIIMTAHGSISLDVRFVGEVKVAGKNDPLVLATDIVVNSLLHHLKGLNPQAPLNSPSSIETWPLAEYVLGVRDGAIEDLI